VLQDQYNWPKNRSWRLSFWKLQQTHNIYWRPTNALQFYWCNFIVLWSPTCFSHSRGHLLGDFLECKNAFPIKLCL